MSLVMNGPFQFFSSLESDCSSGYLEEALLEFGDRLKRRRLLLYTDDDDGANRNPQSYWNMAGSFNCMGHGFSDEQIMSMSMSNISEEGDIFTEMKTPKEEESAPGAPDYNSSPSSYIKDYSADTKILFSNDTGLSKDHKTPRFDVRVSSDFEDERKRKNKRSIITRVVYPFALVKPGGVEGDMTINDINERILMPPTRPLRHPVGDFACRPCVSSPHGTGLSGKAVVALTRIHTQGRKGTITIIRTRG